MSPKKTLLEVDLKEYSLSSVRYAAHSMGGSAYAYLRPGARGRVAVELTPRPGRPSAGLSKAFLAELEDEKLRERISAENRELREFMLLKALNYRPRQPEKDDSGLTPQQEKELNDLIAQIEGEIKAESAGAPSSDPLGITSTWEDKYDNKNRGKKKR